MAFEKSKNGDGILFTGQAPVRKLTRTKVTKLQIDVNRQHGGDNIFNDKEKWFYDSLCNLC